MPREEFFRLADMIYTLDSMRRSKAWRKKHQLNNAFNDAKMFSCPIIKRLLL